MTLNISNSIDSTAAPLPRAIYHSRSKALLGKMLFCSVYFPECTKLVNRDEQLWFYEF